MDAWAVDRREALKRLALGGAAAATLPAWVDTLSALALDHAHTHGQRTAAAATAAGAAAWKPKVLTPHQNRTVIAISELIIPRTSTPGAKAAKVNEFIDGVLAESRPPERATFIAGLDWIDARVGKDFTTTFVAATPEQQTALLTVISAPEAKTTADKTGAEFFDAIKSLTIIGYYTSEVGVREELGDDGTLFFAEFKGCTHPEHQDA